MNTSYSSGWDNARKAPINQSHTANSEAVGSWGTWKSTSTNSWGSTSTPSATANDDKTSKNDPATASNSFSAETIGRFAVNSIGNNTIGSADDEVAPVWFMERVCVQLKKNAAAAVIKEINGNMAVIELEDHTHLTVGSSELSLVLPKEHDSVLVTGGVDVGFEGELACIDGSDAILKDVNEDFKIVDYVHLAKIAVEN